MVAGTGRVVVGAVVIMIAVGLQLSSDFIP
jgi:hypothetical protein